MRRCDSTLPDPAFEDFSGPTVVSTAIANQKERTHQTSHHRMTKGICRHIYVYLVFGYSVAHQDLQLSHRRGTFALLTVSREIV
ncbi:hypothetical protein BAY61_02895 [Prauserella marina]|uniref:Uncharacterized protein n=1 Tax=Prauserella marina TaxID=530584 RepID=A0A222VK67_9PSEU|nr:hypothetical protein BAY61_02895 [Prauserella marina]PWV82752.1 hypothetical protein DES30_102999 [Prauserella marina]SDC76450.1 hypothetical protein SAMN05421630_103535 [Prauserella marina]